jgi:hypothetical protein
LYMHDIPFGDSIARFKTETDLFSNYITAHF